MNLNELKDNKQESSETPVISFNENMAINPHKKKKLVTIIVVLFLLLGVVGGAAAYLYFYKTDNASVPNTLDDKNKTATNTTPTASPTPTEPPKPVFIENPINGVMIPEARFNEIKDRPVLAVIIQNNAASRPQHGINEADLVYETLAEGGITRFMGVFWSKDVERIMSIRSARKYFVDLLGDYKTVVFMHHGIATGAENVNAQTAIARYGVRNLGYRGDAYKRDAACEKQKAREHCLYSWTAILWDLAQKNGWNKPVTENEVWKFKDSDVAGETAGTDLIDFTINFNPLGQKDYSTRWKYDIDAKKYKRFNTNNTPFVDSSGKQVEAEVVVYQKIDSYLANDAKSHVVQIVIGEGTGTIMQNGKAYPVTWKKPNYNTKTRYYDATTGEEFVFNRGRIWVTLVAKANDYKNNAPAPTITTSITVTPTVKP